MAIGFGVLRLAPDVFWSMTPAELAAACGPLSGEAQPGQPSRADLSRLMDQFPDTAEMRNG